MLLPDKYVKDVESISYDKLKQSGVRCLIFDLDNTLSLLSEVEPPERVSSFLSKLQKDFDVFIITNSTGKRALPYKKKLGIPIIHLAMKPLTVGLFRIRHRYHYKKSEMVMIGDQLVTDVFSGKLYHIMTIMVDPLSFVDLKITTLNRFIERGILSHYEKKGVFKKGKYYE